MSEWITINDLVNEYGEEDLPKKYNELDETVINETKVNESIISARLKIESYLRTAGIEIPVTDSIKLELRECIYNITRYFYSDYDGGMTEEIQKRFETCINYLKDIAAGKVKLSSVSTSAGIFNLPLYRG